MCFGRGGEDWGGLEVSGVDDGVEVMVMRLEVRFTMGFVPNVTSLRRTARRKSRWSCCGAYSGGGPVLSGRKVMVDGEVALGSAINGAVLNRFLRDDGEEWMMHMTFRPDDDFDERVMPERISGYVGTAVSNDGISWTINRAALKPNKEDWWCFDTTHCAVGTVQVGGGWMDVSQLGGEGWFLIFGVDLIGASFSSSTDHVQ